MIDLRSDTVTKPTQAMRQAGFDAEVGDDVFEEDPTVRQLEERAAEMFGKEAALYVTSGTQGNQAAVLTHCNPGEEIIMEANAHLFLYEGATMSALAGVQPRTLQGERGAMSPEDVEAAIRKDDIHFPKTSLICLENTHNKAGGAILPWANMKAIHEIGERYNIPIHLDGARIFNASVATGISVKEYASLTDTVQFCLSKGLGAPVGSILVGPKSFIERARKWRKRLGGGMRQAGVIAAPGLVALNEMVDRLAEDHKHAKNLAESVNLIPGLEVEGKVETNIVLINVKETGMNAEEFLAKLKKQGVLAVPFGPYTIRMVTNKEVSADDLPEVKKQLEKCVQA